LALKATEGASLAAASGESFAEVAADVKALAIRTALSTEQARAAIDRVREVGSDVDERVNDIAHRLDIVERTSAGIVDGLTDTGHRSSALDAGLAHLSTQTAGIDDAATRIEDTGHALDASARAIGDTTTAVEAAMGEVRAQFADLIAHLAPDGDRRTYPRYAYDADVTLALGSNTYTLKCRNVSVDGMMVERRSLMLAVDETVMVALDDWNEPLSARVVSIGDDRINLQFAVECCHHDELIELVDALESVADLDEPLDFAA